MEPWFDRAFGPWYLEIYPHRDAAEAERTVDLLAPRLPAGGRLLDVGCGAGRHLPALAGRGFLPVGLDRSRDLLAVARRERAAPGCLVRGDMRELPFRTEAFDGVLSLFTSFGYFGSRDAHRALLAGMSRITRPGGRLVLDYLNAPHVRATLVPSSTRVAGDHRVQETRRIVPLGDGEGVVKELVIEDARGRPVERYREQVSLYDVDEVERLAREAGWRVIERLGTYDGDAWTTASPRCILVGVRPEAG